MSSDYAFAAPVNCDLSSNSASTSRRRLHRFAQALIRGLDTAGSPIRLEPPSSHKTISVIQEALKEHDIDQIWKTHGIR